MSSATAPQSTAPRSAAGPSTARPSPGALGSVEVLAALADPTRWQIVRHLADEELCTTHLQHLLGAKQPVLSHHLRVLRDAGVVSTEPCGRFTYYRLRPGALDALAHALAQHAAAARVTPARRAC